MTTTFTDTHENGSEPAVAPAVEEAQVPKADLASDMEVAQLQDQINTMNAAAQRLENEIAQMMAETGGNAANSSEYTTAMQTARDMRSSADGARAALTSAPTDPKTGKKMISSKKVSSLAGGLMNFIIGGEAEGTKIEAATATTQTHEEADHEKALTEGKAKSAETGVKCTHAGVCLIERPAPARGWMHETFAPVGDFGTRIANSMSRHWNGFTAYVAQLDPVGALKHVAGSIADVSISVVTSVSAHVTAGVIAVKEAGTNAIAAVKETGHTMIAAVKNKLHAGREWVAATLDSVNPFKEKAPSVVAHAKPAHPPIHVNAGAMEKAMEEAKAVVKHTLAHISMPNLMEFVPSSVPSLQSLMGDIGLVH